MLAAAALGQPAESVRAFAEGLLLGSYRFSLASGAAQETGPSEVRILVPAGDQEATAAVSAARAVAEAVGLARDLANMPSSRKTPAWLAGEAARMAAASGLTVRVREPGELAAEGFGGILAVGAGSAQPPCLIELGYHPPGARTHVVLVGKGITFDSGGLSLKPNDGMKAMKTDMAGGAAVIAAMSALAGLGAAVRVTGLIAAAENMPSGSAMRPGDVITHFGGRTTEVLNTDAEGRLVLADALAYADTVLEPDVVVDIATLTGAARVALGGVLGALYASDDALAGALLAAGRGERRAAVADAAGGRLRRRARLPGRGPGERPAQQPAAGGLDRGGAVPARVHRRPSLGAPGHRRRGPVLRRRPGQGRHRVRHPAAAALARAGCGRAPPAVTA